MQLYLNIISRNNSMAEGIFILYCTVIIITYIPCTLLNYYRNINIVNRIDDCNNKIIVGKFNNYIIYYILY